MVFKLLFPLIATIKNKATVCLLSNKIELFVRGYNQNEISKIFDKFLYELCRTWNFILNQQDAQEYLKSTIVAFWKSCTSVPGRKIFSSDSVSFIVKVKVARHPEIETC